MDMNGELTYTVEGHVMKCTYGPAEQYCGTTK